jgi:hypothetical protein
VAVALNHTIVHARDKRASAEFDQIFGRVKARGLDYWADPARKQKGEINRHFGGRGVYFEDPGGHFLEIITRPYGSEG